MKVVVDFHKLKWILFTVYYYSVKINFYPRANGAERRYGPGRGY